MDLKDLIGDMAMRFINTEKKQYAQIRKLQLQIQAVNSNYEVLKAKPHIFIQNIFLYILGMGIFMLLFYLVFNVTPSFKESYSAWLDEDRSRIYIFVALTFIFPIILLILNVIRAKNKQKKRQRKADEWWEQNGKTKVVEINNSIEALKTEAYQYLSMNPLYEQFVSWGWDNSEDCGRVYDVTVRYNLSSIQQAFSVYEEVLEQEYEREQDRYQKQQILDAIEENNQYQAELAEQGRRAEMDRSIIELQLSEIKHRH